MNRGLDFVEEKHVSLILASFNTTAHTTKGQNIVASTKKMLYKSRDPWAQRFSEALVVGLTKIFYEYDSKEINGAFI